jgi:hypothetical protein
MAMVVMNRPSVRRHYTARRRRPERRVVVLGHPVDLIASDMGVTPAAVRKPEKMVSVCSVETPSFDT